MIDITTLTMQYKEILFVLVLEFIYLIRHLYRIALSIPYNLNQNDHPSSKLKAKVVQVII